MCPKISVLIRKNSDRVITNPYKKHSKMTILIVNTILKAPFLLLRIVVAAFFTRS
jgi:hypothetical protein